MTLLTQFHIIGCTIRGYPSSGGIIIGSATAAELEWLGLSRSQNSARSPDQAAEDEFCYQILRLGARWWKIEAFHERRESQISGGYPYPDHFPPMLHVGYPSSGGVFILKQLSGEWLLDGYAPVEMAFTMDERCNALAAVGAKFYSDVEECEEIPKSLEDGIMIGKYWEERMKEIDR